MPQLLDAYLLVVISLIDNYTEYFTMSQVRIFRKDDKNGQVELKINLQSCIIVMD